MNCHLKRIIKYTILLLIVFLLAIFINSVILINVTVNSGSMVPTVCIGDHAVGFRRLLISQYDRGDIIVFCNEETNDKNYVKRIIGLPGETVELLSGGVYINGKRIQDFIGAGYMSADNYGPVTVPSNSYFVLGDNRNHSEDSRIWSNPFVDRSAIKGILLVTYFPSIKTLY